MAKIYELADIYHSDNIERVSDDFISESCLQNGDFDNVSLARYAVPSYWDIGKVYMRLIIGIAKERSESDFQRMAVKKSDERLIIPGQLNPIALKKYRALMMILVQMRDEAHRFSRKLHHHQEKKRIFKMDRRIGRK